MIGIGIIYKLKDQLTGGLGKIKQAFSGVEESYKNFSLKNAQFFQELRSQVPFLDSFVNLIKNPYVAAIGVIAGVTASVIGLGSHLFGVSEKIQKNQQLVKATFGITGKEMESVTAKTIALGKVFDIETKDIILAGNALQKAYADSGLTAGQSLKLIQQGLQATNGLLDLEQIKEYPTQLKSIGLNAEQAIAVMSQGVKQGIFNDKAADTLKEFGLRIREMPEATSVALTKLGINGAKITQQLNSGAKTQFQVLQEISQKLADTKNVQAYQEAVANIFGGPGEDVGKEFLTYIANAKLEMKGLIDLQDPFIKAQNTRLGLEEQIALKQQEFAPGFNQLKAEFDILVLKAQLLFYQVIAGASQIFANLGFSGSSILQSIASGIDYLSQNFQAFLPYLEIGITYLGHVITLASAFYLKTLLVNTALVAFRGIMIAVNLVTSMNPFMLIATTLVLVIAGLKTAYDRSSTFRAILAGIGSVAVAIFKPLQGVATVIAGIMTFNPSLIAKGVGDTIKTFKELNVTEAFKKGYNDSMKTSVQTELQKKREADAKAAQESEAEERRKAMSELGSNPKPTNTIGSGSIPTNTPQATADKVVSSAQQTRNVTVNIDALIKGANFSLHEVKTASGMTQNEFETMMVELLLRAVRNTEATI